MSVTVPYVLKLQNFEKCNVTYLFDKITVILAIAKE